MTRDQIEMLAVALGTDLATVRARLNAAYGPAQVPVFAGGFKSLALPDGAVVEIAVAADGSEAIVKDTRKPAERGKPV